MRLLRASLEATEPVSPYRKGPAGTAEKAHSELVRLRANGVCQRCGRHVGYEGLQAAHIIRRSRAATRVDERNAWALCPPCHSIVDINGVEFMALLVRTVGVAVYDELHALNASPRPWRASDWAAEAKRLRALINDLKGAPR